jgi:hypothetical protein
MDDAERRLRPAWQALLSDAAEFATALPRGRTGSSNRLGWGHALDAMLTDVWDLTGAVLTTVDRMARSAPGHSLVTTRVRAFEVALVNGVKDHLDGLEHSDAGRAAGGDTTGHDDSRARIFHQLLADSRGVVSASSDLGLHLRILRSLLPDEARILAAMANGERYPMLHLEARGPGGSWPILMNACTVGRVAGIHQQNAISVYVGHLRLLGLVDEGPREEALSDQYALLRNELYVQRAIEQSRLGPRGVTETRRTLRISPLGSDLWAACHPGAGARTSVPNGVAQPSVYRSAYGGLPALPRKQGRA